MHLFVCNDNVHVVDTLQAVVSDRQQAVSVGGQVDPHDVGTLVDDHVEEAGALVRKAVVILSPDERSNQQVQ